MKLKFAYFGTPDFSARFLEKLINDKDLPLEVILVVTQPDKPVGRKQIMTPSPVKEIARKYHIDLYDGSLSSFFHLLSSDIDLAVLYAYGDIIPKDLLKAPKYGFWNLHPSLLPKYRGASPIAYPLLLGDRETGVTFIQMDKELDHGPIIAQEKYEILPTDKRPDLEIKLTDLGFELFKKTISNGTIEQLNNRVQDKTLATYARRLTKQDGYIPLSFIKKALSGEKITNIELPEIIKEYSSNNNITIEQSNNSAMIIYNLFRGLTPWPGIWTLIPDLSANAKDSSGVAESTPPRWPGSKRLKITDLTLEGNQLVIKKVQLEGKNEVSFEVFNNVYTLFS